MNKAILTAMLMLSVSFVGCIDDAQELEKTVNDDSEDMPLENENCLQITGQYLSNESAMNFLGTTYNESKGICIVSFHLVDIDEDKKLFVNEDKTRYVLHHQISGTSDDFTMVLLNRTYEIVERDLVIQGSIGSNGNIAVKLVEPDGSIRGTILWVSCKDDCFENAFENLCVVHGDDLTYECELVEVEDFWGDNCDEVVDNICKAGSAPDFELIDQEGNIVTMSQFKGKIVVINFLYTYCPDICPAVIHQMKEVKDELGDNYTESVVFLSVTVDPERDTPEKLASFASSSNASWQFLTSTSDSPVDYMASVWHDYGVIVNIDEGACGDNGHYMEGYEGCHCNPGYVQDSWDVDVCIEDPDYDKNVTFEEGTLEADIITSLNVWSAGLGIPDGQVMAGIDSGISQVFGADWDLVDINGSQHSSSTYYEQNLTLIEFFHTKCSHCQNQIPALKEFHANHSSNVNIVSVGGYSLGSNVDDMSAIHNFTTEYNATWPYLYDESHQLMQNYDMNSYPSWVLLEGGQIVARASGSNSYEQLVDLVENYSEPANISEQINQILDYREHWMAGHISDKEMIEIIANILDYEFEEEPDENYSVSHSSKLYIIDQEGNMRVVWRGYDWTYASVYHDIELLL